MNSLDTCTSSHPRVAAGLLTVFALGLAGCGLWSIDPDTLDIADADDEIGQESEDTAGEANDDGSDTSNGTDDEEGTGTDTASEFSDEETTDGPSDTGTDTEAESTTTDTGDTGDATTDEGETSDPGCEASDVVDLGENPVSVAAGASSYQGSCGGNQSETLYSFTAPADGDYSFTLAGAEFVGVLHLLDEVCAPIADACSSTGDPVSKAMLTGEIVIVVVDSDGGIGSATLSITSP
jgi:hypothetical protein